jgi:hypothetical protein
MAILKIALSLGPSFTLKSFFTHQCSLSTKESGLRTKRKSRNIFFMKKNYCATFTLVTTKMRAKSKLKLKIALPQIWEEKAILNHVYYQIVNYFLLVRCLISFWVHPLYGKIIALTTLSPLPLQNIFTILWYWNANKVSWTQWELGENTFETTKNFLTCS